MIRISKTTHLPPESVIDRAARFFGKDGVGLSEAERGNCCISFSAADGYVSVRLSEEPGRLTVDVESREYDYQARQFLGRL